jgi:hypothetical protein
VIEVNPRYGLLCFILSNLYKKTSFPHMSQLHRAPTDHNRKGALSLATFDTIKGGISTLEQFCFVC